MLAASTAASTGIPARTAVRAVLTVAGTETDTSVNSGNIVTPRQLVRVASSSPMQLASAAPPRPMHSRVSSVDGSIVTTNAAVVPPTPGSSPVTKAMSPTVSAMTLLRLSSGDQSLEKTQKWRGAMQLMRHRTASLGRRDILAIQNVALQRTLSTSKLNDPITELPRSLQRWVTPNIWDEKEDLEDDITTSESSVALTSSSISMTLHCKESSRPLDVINPWTKELNLPLEELKSQLATMSVPADGKWSRRESGLSHSILTSSSYGYYVLSNQKLGAGRTAQVKLAQHLNSARVMAVKIIPRHLARHKQLSLHVDRETAILSQLGRLETRIDTKDKFYLLQMYVPGEPVDMLPYATMSARDILTLADSVIATVRQFHSRTDCIHGDLHCRNILVTRNGNVWIVHIVDFGSVRKASKIEMDLEVRRLSLPFARMARQRSQNQRVDAYSEFRLLD